MFIGYIPFKDIPNDIPAIESSAIGVSITRLGYFFDKPKTVPKMPLKSFTPWPISIVFIII